MPSLILLIKKNAFPHIDPSGCSCVDRKSSDLGLGGIRREYLQTVYFQIRNLSLCLCLDDEKLTESEENRNFMFLFLFSDYIHDIWVLNLFSLSLSLYIFWLFLCLVAEKIRENEVKNWYALIMILCLFDEKLTESKKKFWIWNLFSLYLSVLVFGCWES